jgi:hypothetical protein
MASDLVPEPLFAHLRELRDERDELRLLRTATRDRLRALLEGEQPAWYRFRARSEHAASKDRATSTVGRIDRELLKLDSRENQLLEQLARERAREQGQRIRDRVVRARERGHDVGRGL